MNIELSGLEARVIGCMIEKQITTPDQYPLSANALTNACNQKSNRDPVMDLDERAVQQVIDGLIRKHFVIERSGFGSRVPKYGQVFCNSEFGSLKMSALKTAIICELMVRGPQTPGELRTRANRMSEVKDAADVETALQELAADVNGPFVVRLPREPGRRDSRYMHLFCGAVAPTSEGEDSKTTLSMGADVNDDSIENDRLSQLERLVDELRKEVVSLKQRLGDG
ncbi:MAG: DUF480 domain-containing protein [Candidatus Obscuribacterales bacterium]|nr:DUF480 domain-containing protein [Steroidobacteraceae bacterium]